MIYSKMSLTKVVWGENDTFEDASGQIWQVIEIRQGNDILMSTPTGERTMTQYTLSVLFGQGELKYIGTPIVTKTLEAAYDRAMSIL